MSEQTPRELFARFQRNALAGGAGLDEEMLAEDVVIEMPFAPDGHARRMEGRAAIAARLREGRAALPIIFEEFRDVVIHETADPEVIVAEYVMVATMPARGRRASANFAVVLRARDGRVVHWREYQDRAAITEALAG
ncbi:nuclear transport factor 2 family protein [Actinomadura opuntiae]|uniref:nuclear transport factor 2 family protein n=1 Tax=Actinomadura sp. OS1-43 TaxID=604315 RepID=UPI00255AB295|nr:nuclear transport factor 2 family protein [Actinomadura sp. OS1-43]MDL4820303.1 nuclear transport factor 2 family protein [Actinomadura sp. OS1-43]